MRRAFTSFVGACTALFVSASVAAALTATVLPVAAQAKMGPPQAGTYSVKAPMRVACHVSPSIKARPASASPVALAAFCHRYGKPVAPRARTSQVLCGNAGCSYLNFFNEGGGWAYAEWQSDPYGWTGGIWYGAIAVQRYRKLDGDTAYITDKVTPNCGGGFDYCGERYQYPIDVHGTITPGWVADTYYGWCYDRHGDYIVIGPVVAWNYIT